MRFRKSAPAGSSDHYAHGHFNARLMLRRCHVLPVCCIAMDLLRDKPAGRFSAARLFRPDSVVVIGAASEVGGQVMANLRSGGFKGGGDGGRYA